MKDIDQGPIISTLSQDIERDGKRVWIDIVEDDEGGWQLEVVDEHGNWTGWFTSFKTEQEALDEALQTIDREGIDSLISSIAGLPQDELMMVPCPCGSGNPYTTCCGVNGVARVLH